MAKKIFAAIVDFFLAIKFAKDLQEEANGRSLIFGGSPLESMLERDK